MDVRSSKTGYGYSSLHNAVISRDIKAVQALTSTEACDLESRDSMGFTALHLATLQGSEQLVQLLVQAGSDVNSRTKVSIPEKSLTISEHFKQKECASLRFNIKQSYRCRYNLVIIGRHACEGFGCKILNCECPDLQHKEGASFRGFQANQQYWKKLGRENEWKACSSQANQWKRSKKLLFLATCPRHDDTIYKLKFSSQCSRFPCFHSCMAKHGYGQPSIVSLHF